MRYNKISHGVIPMRERLEEASNQVNAVNRQADLPFSFAITSRTSRFDYLFPQLQIEDALLPQSPDVRARLVNLGSTMTATTDETKPDSVIPSAYTYLGQFIDHDITFEAKSGDIEIGRASGRERESSC